MTWGSAGCPARSARVISAEHAVTGYASGNYGQLVIDGQIVPAIGLDQPPSGGYLTMLAGRAPAAPDEIALGAQTLRAIHARVGQTIPVTVEQVAADLPRRGATCASPGWPCCPPSAAAHSRPPASAPGP